MSEEIISRKE